jgi:hypothetical protein
MKEILLVVGLILIWIGGFCYGRAFEMGKK